MNSSMKQFEITRSVYFTGNDVTIKPGRHAPQVAWSPGFDPEQTKIRTAAGKFRENTRQLGVTLLLVPILWNGVVL